MNFNVIFKLQVTKLNRFFGKTSGVHFNKIVPYIKLIKIILNKQERHLIIISVYHELTYQNK